MKKTRITITHQLEKTKHTFLVVNPDKLTRIESEKNNEKDRCFYAFCERKALYRIACKNNYCYLFDFQSFNMFDKSYFAIPTCNHRKKIVPL